MNTKVQNLVIWLVAIVVLLPLLFIFDYPFSWIPFIVLVLVWIILSRRIQHARGSDKA